MSAKWSAFSWRQPPRRPRLGRDEVHVWRARLDRDSTEVQDLQRVLSSSEWVRASKYRFEKHRNRFIVARGLLRIVLSRYQDGDPDRLCFRYGPYGKPYLVIVDGEEPLQFNVSHSLGLALIVVARKREVGVDLERVRSDVEYEQIAARFFAPQETTVLRALPKELRPRAFFSCWTRKEAYIKARGEGLSMPLDQFVVSLAPDEPAKLLDHRIVPREVSRWLFQELIPDQDFVAAVVAAGQDWRLRRWNVMR